MSNWQPYELDKIAQDLVLKYREKEEKLNAKKSKKEQKETILNEAHKMRTTVAFGLERFWGEHLRLLGKSDKDGSKDKLKGEYWRDVWEKLVKIFRDKGINIPQGKVDPKNTQEIRETAKEFWDKEKFPLEDQRICLTILTQLCDSLVWWTQRYKNK